MQPRDYEIEAIPRGRATIVDALAVGARRHMVHGFVEVDVTRARRIIRQHQLETGEALSFTAFIVAAAARAIAAHKHLNAYRDWRHRLVVFDDVDVATLIESEADGVAVAHVIRAANRKSALEIHREIRAVQARPASSPQRSGYAMRLSGRVPGFVRRLFLRVVRRFPRWLRRLAGTTIVTAVGMFGGKGGGWAVGIVPLHTLGLTLGGIAERSAVDGGKIVTREVLDLTVSVDHDVVDGAPAARFIRDLREAIEMRDGDDLLPRSPKRPPEGS
jgi:pyruvate/2-oxoglutarate dehydrogenase complex dihydrolipoamide acyltransferase (E2) component